MEGLISSLCPALFTFLLILLTLKLLIWKRTKKSNISAPNLPPGPSKLPFIGNLHQLIGSLPHQRLRDLSRKYGPLMHLQLGELSHVVVSSSEVAHEMMKTHDLNFLDRPFFSAASLYEFKNFSLAPYGDYWRQLRKICREELLSTARVRCFRSIREEEVSGLIKYLYSATGNPVNLSEKIFSLTYGIIAKAAFGKKCKDQEAFIATINEGFKLAGSLGVSDLFPSRTWLHLIAGLVPNKHEKIFKRLDMILQDIVETCKADMPLRVERSAKEKCLLDILFDIQDKGDSAVPMENLNIKATILDVFVGGGETSSTVVEWAMFELSRNPEVMQKAQAEVRRVFGRAEKIDEARFHELNYLKLIIKETLRLHPPAPLLIPRECRESCAINGYDIPAKTKVLVNAWAIGRDPRHWTNPEKFYPERFIDSDIDFKGTNFELIPFGAGRRMCPGVSFAVADIELSLVQLLFHFDWKLPCGHENPDATESFGLTARIKNELYLIPVPYKIAGL